MQHAVLKHAEWSTLRNHTERSTLLCASHPFTPGATVRTFLISFFQLPPSPQFRRLAHAAAGESRRQALHAAQEVASGVAPRIAASAARKAQQAQALGQSQGQGQGGQGQGKRTWVEWWWGAKPAPGAAGAEQLPSGASASLALPSSTAGEEGGGGSEPPAPLGQSGEGDSGGGAAGKEGEREGEGASPGRGAGKDMTPELSPQEWQRLQELVAGPEPEEAAGGGGAAPGEGAGRKAGPGAPAESPYSVQMSVEVRVESASVRLVDTRALALPSSAVAAAGAPSGGGRSGRQAAAPGAVREVEVCCASLRQLALRLVRYPATLALALAVGAADVTSEHGPLFSTVCTTVLSQAPAADTSGPAGTPQTTSHSQSKPAQSGAPSKASSRSTSQGVSPEASQASLESGAGVGTGPGGSSPGESRRGTAGGSSQQGAQQPPAQQGRPPHKSLGQLLLQGQQAAFLMDFVSKPQDGSADATLQLLIAPSFITYSPKAVAGVVGFFSSGTKDLQLTALQVWGMCGGCVGGVASVGGCAGRVAVPLCARGDAWQCHWLGGSKWVQRFNGRSKWVMACETVRFEQAGY